MKQQKQQRPLTMREIMHKSKASQLSFDHRENSAFSPFLGPYQLSLRMLVSRQTILMRDVLRKA